MLCLPSPLGKASPALLPLLLTETCEGKGVRGPAHPAELGCCEQAEADSVV